MKSLNNLVLAFNFILERKKLICVFEFTLNLFIAIIQRCSIIIFKVNSNIILPMLII
jgi:hypothetical protein